MVSGISGFGSFNAASLSEMRQKMFTRIDTDGDGSINKSEFSALAGQNSSSLVDEIFSKMDTDQDSLVSMIEFDATLAKLEQQMKKGDSGMQAMSGMPPPPPPDQVFDAADANSDGSVTQDELAAVLGDKAADVFSQVDTDGDGKISRTEDEAFRAKMEEQMGKGDSGMQAMSGMPPPPDKVFDTADADGDKSVTQDELTAILGDEGADIFSQVDTDGDGKISRTEDEAFRAKMDDQMKQNVPSDPGRSSISGFGQDWQSKLFDALVSALTASTTVSSDSTSRYA
jgi:Ca2+-binding EF-hand superfamily protein